MPKHVIRLAALVQSLADESLLAEALLFPEASCCGNHPGQVREMLRRRVRDIVRQLAPGTLWQRRMADLPELKKIEVEVPPLSDDVGRRDAVALTFRYVQWRHGADAVIAYVPALEMEVLAEDERQLAELLGPQIMAALARRRSAASLPDLAWLDQFADLRVKPLALSVHLPTLKQSAQRERDYDLPHKSVLKEVATDLGRQPSHPVYERDDLLARLVQPLTARTPHSVLLVGRSGVGKSALVHEMAHRRAELQLGRTPIWSTSGSRLIAGMSGFGMWQERCQTLVREAGHTRAIVHLDNLVELIEVGKGGGNPQGIAAMLRPAIARGAMRTITECTPQQLAFIERDDPQLLAAFIQLDIPEPSPDQTRSILKQVAGERSKAAGPAISAEALATLDRLHRRYATYSAAPGRQLRFLRNLLEDRPGNSQISSSIVTSAFSHETGLPLFMLDDALPLDVNETRAWFDRRVIGQPEPVNVVVELLAAVKAGLARGGKPLASLLFIGPTGVGKTELAKALAEFLYQDPGRMVRFDMSEYATADSVERLIGGSRAAGLLTQRVRDQPFMVVLLDEFEKAHPALYDLLLQVLGEGRLTDAAGRVADFTNSVVIMTSNLGADSFRRAAVGFGGEVALATTAQRHFEREVRLHLRPEMFNRLDRIIVFAPLDRTSIAGIAQREIERVKSRDGLRLRGVQLDIAPAVIDHLATWGFDARYGARPLKRAIERTLVAPLAEQLGRYAGELTLDCRARMAEGTLQLETAAMPRGGGSAEPATADRVTPEALRGVIQLRRQLQKLERSSVILRLRNEIARLRQAERERHRKPRFRGKSDKFVFSAAQAQILAQEGLLRRIDTLVKEVQDLEDESLGNLYAGRPVDGAAVTTARELEELALREILFELHRADGEKRGELILAIFGESLNRVLELAQAYERICAADPVNVHLYWLKIYNPALDVSMRSSGSSAASQRQPLPIMHLKSRKLRDEDVARKVVDVFAPPSESFCSPTSDVIGVALRIVADRPAALLETEIGKHEFVQLQGQPQICVVETHRGLLVNYDPPADAGRAGAFKDVPPRRTYDHHRELCRDHRLETELRIRGRSIDEAVTRMAADYLAQRIWSLLD
jgi:ATP-dependent Clp protease ATP-binding subunit ClpC